jgi:hypothetical protein
MVQNGYISAGISLITGISGGIYGNHIHEE